MCISKTLSKLGCDVGRGMTTGKEAAAGQELFCWAMERPRQHLFSSDLPFTFEARFQLF